MERLNDLIGMLNCEEEPLSKRLKLANTAFKSPSLPIHFKEIAVLKWLLELGKNGDKEILQKANEWLHSEEIVSITKIDVSQEYIFDILKTIAMIISYGDNSNFEELIVDSFLRVISNKTFQQYFRYDLKVYFKFICQVLENIKTSDQLLLVLKSDDLFSKLYFTETKSYKTFCKVCLPVLAKIMVTFDNKVKKEIVILVNKCLFQKNSKLFENYLKNIFQQTETTNDFTLPTTIIKVITENYNKKNSSIISLIYSSFCTNFETKFEVIYQFTVLLLQICGIDVKQKLEFPFDYDDCDYNIDFSIDVISNIYQGFKSFKTNPNYKINNFNFSMTTQALLITIMKITNPSKAVLNIFTNAIQAEPLILEPMLSSILPYVMFSDVNENGEEYKQLLTTIFAVSAKLYRLSNLISKMLPCIKEYSPSKTFQEESFDFKGSFEKKASGVLCDIEFILPQEVLDCFSKHVLDLPSWQVINIFKTFVHHLKVVSEGFNEANSDKFNHTYIELLCTLFCTFLSSVRITEHTTPDLVVNKFVKCMLDLKDVLQIFGNRLLEMNHNQYIMRSYLNVCYLWGELSLLLNFYSSASEVSNLKPATNTNDYQVCCTSYIHSFLTADQWCSVTERITNFGEKKCKNVLQLLQLQSIKAIYLFENGKVDVAALFLRNLTPNPSLEGLLSDKFVNKVLMPNLQQDLISSLGKQFIKEVLHEENHDFWSCGVLESPELTEVILLNILIKIGKCSKAKKEKEQININELLSTLFQTDIEEIVCDASKYFDAFKNFFKQQNLNESKLNDYISLLKKLPILTQNANVQLIIFLYLSALLKCLIKEEISIKAEVEKLVIGIIQYPSEMLTNLPIEYIIPFILNNITDFKSTFQYWLGNMLQNTSNFMKQFESLVSYLLLNFSDDVKIRVCVIQVLNYLNKNKKNKLLTQLKNEINKEREKIFTTINEWQSSNKEHSSEVVHFYALSLKYYLSIGSNEKSKLKKNFKKYLKRLVNDSNDINNEASLLLFSTILIHKNQLEGVDDQVILDIWNIVRTLKVENYLRKEYSGLIVLIFEHISNEKFSVMCEDLKKFVDLALKENNEDELKEVMLNVNGVFQCSLNPIKQKIWQVKVEEILVNLIDVLTQSTDECFWEQVINFEVNIVQANHFMITALIIDEIFRTIIILFSKSPKSLVTIFKPSVQMLTLLLKYRMPLITDRLPPFLQKYRILLAHLCKASDSSLNLSTSEIEELADCAHQLERLTNMIVGCGRHVQRISPYLVADILKQYESISLYSSIKMHIDNCLYNLMSLFDQHMISFLMRSLSTASTELFKYMHSNYKRYYKFTGKV